MQAQLSHGFPYTDRRADYGSTLSGGATHGGRLAHEHDPLALHQALQNAVDDVQNPGIDDNVAFMSDLPLIKSKYYYDRLLRCMVYSVIICSYEQKPG